MQAQAKLGTHHGSSCSAEQLPAKARAMAAEVSAPLSGTEWAQTWQVSGQRRDHSSTRCRPSCSAAQLPTRAKDAAAGDCLAMEDGASLDPALYPDGESVAITGTCCSSAPLWGRGASAGSGGAHTEGAEPALT